ncbi:MAG: class III poly(R)-hydroxyalkanoic acid synthase subunit PhaC [Thiothrix nivea]|nr:MAG: class III poly(R)-hydroxyalkanoic acid synthase subunit PhaC [Thiothrix nivea]
MDPFQISPESIIKEIGAFQEKLSTGLSSLLKMDELSSGVTPHDVVFECGKLRLLHYHTDPAIKRNPVPLIIVYALVNRPYMADLQENRSTVQGLLDSGQDVYLVDWGYPEQADRYLTLDDYLNHLLHACVNEVCRRHGIKQINLLGICQGGVFSLCYSAMHPEKVKNLVTMVTPVDFHTEDNLLSHWAQPVNADQLVDTLGNVPGEWLNRVFLSLKPYRLMGQKYLEIVDRMDDPQALDNFLRMEKWIFDSPDQAGETFRQFLKDFIQQNKLIKSEIEIGTHRVDLANINMPVLNIYAEQDHLVPPSASTVLSNHVGTDDYSEMSFKGGHIGIYVSGKAQKTVPPAIGSWLNARV